MQSNYSVVLDQAETLVYSVSLRWHRHREGITIGQISLSNSRNQNHTDAWYDVDKLYP